MAICLHWCTDERERPKDEALTRPGKLHAGWITLLSPDHESSWMSGSRFIRIRMNVDPLAVRAKGRVDEREREVMSLHG
jgi:hypothetical protein